MATKTVVKKLATVYETKSLTQPIPKGAEKKTTQQQARKALHALIDDIPAKDLARFVGAQITIIS